MEFAEATPTAMIAPISEGTLSVVPVMNSIAQQTRYRRAIGGERGRHRGVAELAQRAHQTLRRLDRDVVGNPGFRVGPEIGRELFRGAEAGIDIIGDSLCVARRTGAR